MTDEERAAMFLKNNGYLIVDGADNIYPDFKDLALASGATKTIMKIYFPRINSGLTNRGGYEGLIEYCQLPTSEHVIYNPDIYPIGLTDFPKKS